MAALQVAQDQATDDLLVRLLEQLLEQPQGGDADLGKKGSAGPRLPGVPGNCSLRQEKSRQQVLGGAGGCWSGSRKSAQSSSVTNLMCAIK